MATEATNFNEAVQLLVPDSNRLSKIINGTSTEEVQLDDGSYVPSVRKSMVENLKFLPPIDWVVGEDETVFNQLRLFTDGSWWYAENARPSTPVPMGVSPYNDSNWVLSPLNTQVIDTLVDIQGEWIVGSDVKKGQLWTSQGYEWRSLTGISVEPSDGADWRKNINQLNLAETLEKSLGINARIWPKDHDLVVGDVIPSAQDTADGFPITHLVVNGNVYAMSPLASGLVSELTATDATIGGTVVSLFPAGSTITVQTMSDLLSLPSALRTSSYTYIVKEYHLGTDIGGGQFYYDAKRATKNDGGTVLDGFVRMVPDYLTPDDFGAIPDVPESQTSILQNAMNATAAIKKVLYVNKKYSVSATQFDVAGADPYGVMTPSGLIMAHGPTGGFVQVGAPYPKSAVILIWGCSNVYLWTPKVTGTRLTQSTTLPEQNHGIRILECENVYLYRPETSNTLGDGIYIGRTWSTEGWVAPTNVTIYEPRVDRARRNGISCCAWDNVTIIRPHVTNVRDIDGIASLAPRSGIDIEPESAGENHTDLIKTRNLKIIDPILLDCDTPFICYIQTKSLAQEITASVEGTMRIKGTNKGWVAPPFAIQNRGVNCTGWLRIERVIDETPKATPDDGVHYGVILQNNASLSNGLAVDINAWEVKNQESGTYAFVCLMLDVPDSYSYYQGNIRVRNITLPRGVQGAFGCRATPEVSSQRAIRDLSLTISHDNSEKGFNGIRNVKNLNNAVILQGLNCYFDGVTTLSASVAGDEVFGNRFRIDNNAAADVIVDISNKTGKFEVIKELASNSSRIALKGIALGGTNAFRSSSPNASLSIVKTSGLTTDASVHKSSGDWVAVAL